MILLAIGLVSMGGHVASAESALLQCPPGDSIRQPALNQCVAPDDSKGGPIRLYVPDGQLRSSPVRLFVNRNISMSDKPSVCLYSGHALTPKNSAEDLPQRIDYVAPGSHGPRASTDRTLRIQEQSYWRT